MLSYISELFSIRNERTIIPVDEVNAEVDIRAITTAIDRAQEDVTSIFGMATSMKNAINLDHNKTVFIENANKIYRLGQKIVKELPIRGNSFYKVVIYHDLTPVVVKLNTITGHEGLQNDRQMLIAAVKAHRIMIELVMTAIFINKTSMMEETRNVILDIAQKLKRNIPQTIENAALIHEIKRLEKATIMLTLPQDFKLFRSFLRPIGKTIQAFSHLEFYDGLDSLSEVGVALKRAWPSSTYFRFFFLEATAMNIVNIDAYRDKHFYEKIEQNERHALYFINILKVIFEVSDPSWDDEPAGIKKAVIEDLKKLTTIHLNGTGCHRYIQTRVFAAKALCDIGCKLDNESIKNDIHQTLSAWNNSMKKNTPKKSAEERAIAEKYFNYVKAWAS